SDAAGHNGGQHGLQRACRSGRLLVAWPGPARRVQCRAGQPDPPDPGSPGPADCHAERRAGDARSERGRSGGILSRDMRDMFDLSGRVALVTGASSGIGLASASALASRGAKVYLNGRNEEKLRAVIADFSAQGWSAEALPFDVGDIALACRRVDE